MSSWQLEPHNENFKAFKAEDFKQKPKQSSGKNLLFFTGLTIGGALGYFYGKKKGEENKSAFSSEKKQPTKLPILRK